MPAMTMPTEIPWQFVVKAAVDWAREAVDVRAIFNDAAARKSKGMEHSDVPAVQVAKITT